MQAELELAKQRAACTEVINETLREKLEASKKTNAVEKTKITYLNQGLLQSGEKVAQLEHQLKMQEQFITDLQAQNVAWRTEAWHGKCRESEISKQKFMVEKGNLCLMQDVVKYKTGAKVMRNELMHMEANARGGECFDFDAYHSVNRYY